MSGNPADVRVRRPQTHERLVLEMGDAGFGTFRDALLFAAALGASLGRRVPFSNAIGDPIRYETLTAPMFSAALVSMIAAVEVAADPEIMDGLRLEERVRIFEEFANGGLEYIQEQVNVRHQAPEMVVISLVNEAFASGAAAEQLTVDELLNGTSWS